MPVFNYFDRERELILTHVSADATIEEILRANVEMSAIASIDVCDGVILFDDLNSVVGDSPNGLRRLSRQLNQLYGPGDTSRTAFVVTKDVDYGLLRIYTTYRGRDAQYFRLFYELTEALEWIGLAGSDLVDYMEMVERLKSGEL